MFSNYEFLFIFLSNSELQLIKIKLMISVERFDYICQTHINLLIVRPFPLG